MRALRKIASAVLLSALVAASEGGSNDTQLVFSPQRGVALDKRFDFDLRLRCVSLTLDGTNVALPPIEVRLESSVRSIDRYAAVERGAPRDFVRRFESLSGKWWLDDDATDISGFDRLTGTEVRFVWDAQLGEYVRTPLGDAPRASFACLAEDMDLRGLLPTEVVAEGARWTASGPAVIDALWASTELGLCAAGEESVYERLVRQVLLPPLRSLAAEKLRIECASEGESRVFERDVHRIALRVDERIESDLTELANEFASAGSLADGQRPIERLTTRWELSGKGALDWSARGGHFAQFELDLVVALEVRCELRIGGEQFEVEMRWTGEAEWSSCAQSRNEK